MSSQENKDQQILLPAGVLRIHASVESTSTTSMKKENKARRTLPQNTLKYLRNHFLNIDNLHSRRLDEKGIVVTIEPSKPYSYGGVMVVAMHEEFVSGVSQEEKLVETFNIYDYNSELQNEYFKQILAGLSAHINTKLPHGNIESDPQAIVVENTQIQISDFNHKMARSIALPHANIMRIGNWIDSTTSAPSYYSLRKEQEYLQSQELFHEFKEFYYLELSKEVNNHLDLIANIRWRGVPPYGYTLFTSINFSDPLDEQAEALSSSLGKNHDIYKNFTLLSIEEGNKTRKLRYERAGVGKIRKIEDQIIPQPSYRTYIYFVNGQLRVTISPAILSTAGVIEAAEIFFHRSPLHPQIYSDAELEEYRVQFTENFRKQLR